MTDTAAAVVSENGVTSTQEETPGFKVFAGNLAYSVNDEGLKAFFAPVQSDILSAQVIMRGTRSAGYGFVALSTTEAAHKAVEALNNKELDGRKVIVEVAKPADQKEKDRAERRTNRRKPGRRGSKPVPGEVSEAEANGVATDKADETGGGAAADAADSKPKKKKVNRKPRRKGPPAGSAPAEGASTTGASDSAAPADAPAPKRRQPKPRQPRPQRPKRPAGEDPEGEPSKTMLFVANLSFSIDDAGLAALFTDAGIAVNSARVVRKRFGHPRKSKGYGFVDVGNEDEQKKAIAALQGKELEGGRQLAVKVAVDTPREEEADKEAEATPAAADN